MSQQSWPSNCDSGIGDSQGSLVDFIAKSDDESDHGGDVDGEIDDTLDISTDEHRILEALNNRDPSAPRRSLRKSTRPDTYRDDDHDRIFYEGMVGNLEITTDSSCSDSLSSDESYTDMRTKAQFADLSSSVSESGESESDCEDQGMMHGDIDTTTTTTTTATAAPTVATATTTITTTIT